MNPESARSTLLQFNPQDDGNLAVLDQLLSYVNIGSAEERKVATELLLEFEERPENLFLTPQIIERSQNDETKFFMMNLLQRAISIKWKAIPTDQRPGIKAFVGQLAMGLAVQHDTPKFMQTKVNNTLISIVKYEWPVSWPTFIDELVELAKSNEMVCLNVLRIFIALSNEVSSAVDLTHGCKEQLEKSIKDEFDKIYGLCIFILELYISGGVTQPNLLLEVFNCFKVFIPQVGLEVLLKLNLIDFLADKFFDVMACRNEVLKIYIEIITAATATCPIDVPSLEKMITQVLRSLDNTAENTFMYHLTENVPVNSKMYWEDYYFDMSRFLSFFMMNYLVKWQAGGSSTYKDFKNTEFLEYTDSKIATCIKYLLKFSEMAHEETVKVMLDFWQVFTQHIYTDFKKWKERTAEAQAFSTNLVRVALGVSIHEGCPSVSFIAPEMTKLCRLIIGTMSKPPEVYVKYDEDTGTIRREYETDTEEVHTYNQMKDILTNLTRSYQTEIERILYEELARYADDEKCRGDLSAWNWNPASFNKLCWAVGSISGVMNVEAEKKFLTKIIFKLLWLCEHRSGRENKAIIASMTMYVVGQYPRFLKRLYKFMEAVVDKLFMFMDEDFPGVQQMAVETLLKISHPLKRELSLIIKDKVSANNVMIGQSLTDVSIPVAISKMEKMENAKNIMLLYESIAVMISGGEDQEHRIASLDIILERPLGELSAIWSSLHNSNYISEMNSSGRQKLAMNMRTLSTVCEHVDMDFAKYFDQISQCVMELYGCLSSAINEELTSKGVHVSGHEHVKQLRLCKKEILVILSIYIKNISKHLSLRNEVTERYREMVLFVLKDYNSCHVAVKDVEVLRFLNNIVQYLEEAIIPSLPDMFQLVFECTLNMISTDFHTNMDHRMAFYQLLMSCTKNALEGILRLPSDQLKLYVECLAFGFRHQQPTISDLGLSVTHQFLSTIISKSEAEINGQYHSLLVDFCKGLFKDMFRNILSVATDTLHKNGLFAQCEILRLLVYCVMSGLVVAPEEDLDADRLCEWSSQLVHAEFQNIPPEQIKRYFEVLLSRASDQNAFREVMVDLLVDSKLLHNEDINADGQKQQDTVDAI